VSVVADGSWQARLAARHRGSRCHASLARARHTLRAVGAHTANAALHTCTVRRIALEAR
jgi:hypothetical protein